MLSTWAAGIVNAELAGNTAGSAFASPNFLALLTQAAVPSDDGTTLLAKEAIYAGYTRTEVKAVVWRTEGAALVNAESLPLTPATGGSSLVVAWALCTDAVGGHVIFFGDSVGFIVDVADPNPVIGAGLLRHAFG